ncbi:MULTISPECIES: hypothetical protein [unclassified Streptomyces]|uniref:hypothetical protein n=1 Tax=unclassified Streptomyces TaxID=2593676 RepID=UPI002E81F226|nr:hypothetical protein [Streptomyces sp. NBC_00589]WTI39134.1 hypothetical protein OIC96_31260 [Streptomyces sp. NBC_00775]WUB27187.1 hypothetical protein OHA51_18475 [Streptomyces sp. NBC_00589]
MTVEELPLLADVFPQLTADILRLLDPDDTVLIKQIPTLRYYGACTCTPTCRNLLTAPQGSPTPYVCQLEENDEAVMWLSLDPSATVIVTIEVLDGRDLGPASVQRS